MSYPLWQWELVYDFLRADANVEWQTLVGFFNGQLGGAYLFAFNDPDDNTVTNQAFGVGDGVTTFFQLVRSLGGFTEPVSLQNVITNIKINGTPTAAYTINTTGGVTFTSAPAAAASLTWTGTYYWPCRFDIDQADFSKLLYQFWELQKITFESEKII